MAKSAIDLSMNLTLNAQSLNTATKEIRQSLGRITGNASEFQKSLDASTARVFAFGASTLVINGVNQAFKALVSTTIDVEKRLIEINSIFGGTASEFGKFRESIFQVAKDTGQSFATVADAAAEFARQGLSAEETAKRLEAALILTRVSGLDSVKAVSALTAAINGFTSAGLTAAQITNKLIAVDTKFAVSAKDLAEGFSRAGSTAEDAGVSFDELLGIITSVQQTTSRGGAVIGNALKSIFTRLSRSTTIEELQALGVAINSSQTGIEKLKALSSALEQISDPSKASQIKELAGGVFQINVVSAALKDLSKQSSIFSQATAISAAASNEALQKNEELNKSLAAQLNSLVIGFTNLAEKIGQLTFAPLLSTLVGLAAKVSDFFDKSLDPEKGNKFIQGLLKSIGSFLSGPGLVLITTAFLKIITLVARYAKEGFSSVLAIGSQSEKLKSIQDGIVNSLINDKKFREQILSSALTLEQKQKAIGDAIARENALLRDQQQILGAISRQALSIGVTGFNSEKGFVGKSGKPIAASGYVPNFQASAQEAAMETAAAREYGYKAGKVYNTRLYDGTGGSFKATVNSAETVKTVRGENGKLGTYVIPPNGFAAKGYVPNFADYSKETSRNNLLSVINNKSGRKTPAEVAAAKARMLELDNKKSSIVNINELLASQGISDLPIVLTPNTSTIINRSKKNFLGSGRDAQYQFKSFNVKNGGIDKLGDSAEKNFNDQAIKDFAESKVLPFANEISRAVGGNPVSPESIEKVDKVKGFVGAVRGAFGSLFDAAISTALQLTSAQKDGADFDVRLSKQPDKAKYIQQLFGTDLSTSKGLGDFKIGSGDATADSMIAKTNKEYASLIQKGLTAKTKASGFIPNFAKYVYDSDRLAPDKGATLNSILSSKVKKNLIIGPAGAGKSTFAGKGGQFISAISDISKATEIDILSGAARTKGGGLSKGLESIIASVNASGGKVSYLYAKNLEILARRSGRTSPAEGDLRSAKQLKGTKYAPLNQFDFLGGVKSKSKRFDLIKAASGYIPNFSAVKDAIKREQAAGIPKSAIYLDSSSSLQSSRNPNGLMVANTIDEPMGGFQGINRARKEGRNPKTYGAAGGFIPNYATPQPQIGKISQSSGGSVQFIDQRRLDIVNKELDSLSKQLKTKKISLANATKKIGALNDNLGYTSNETKALNRSSKRLLTAYDAEIKGRQKRAKELMAERSSGGAAGKGLGGGFSKLGGALNNAQIGLFALSTVSNTLFASNKELNDGIQKAVLALSTLSALGSVGGIAKSFLALTGPLGLLAVGLVAAVGSVAFFTNEANKAVKEGIQVDKRIAKAKANFREEGQFSLQASGLSEAQTKEEIAKIKVEDDRVAKLNSSQTRLAEVQEQVNRGFGKTVFDFVTFAEDIDPELLKEESRLLKEIKNLEKQGQETYGAKAEAAKKIAQAEAKLKTTTEKAQRLALEKTNSGQLASGIIGISNSLSSQQPSLKQRRDELVKQQSTTEKGSEEEKRITEELATLNADLESVNRQLINTFKTLEEVIKGASSNIDSSFDSAVRSLKDSISSLSSAIEESSKAIFLRGQSISIASGLKTAIDPRTGEGKFSGVLEKQLQIAGSKNQAELSRNDFKQSILDISKEVGNINISNDVGLAEKTRQAQTEEFQRINKLNKPQGTTNEAGLTIDQQAVVNREFQLNAKQERDRAKINATNQIQTLQADLQSGKLDENIFNDFYKTGEKGLKDALQKTFSTVNFESDQGKEIFDKAKESAIAYRDNLIKGYTEAKNIQTEINNQISQNGLELIAAQKQALSELPNTLKNIQEAGRVDPTSLFKKFEEAAKLLKTGKAEDTVKANQILASTAGETERFKALYGQGSLESLQQNAGLTPDVVSKSVSAASLGKIDFTTIEQIIRDKFGNGVSKALRALDAVKADPAKLSGFVDTINNLSSGGSTKLKQAGNQIVGSLGFGVRGGGGPSVKQLNQGLESNLLQGGLLGGKVSSQEVTEKLNQIAPALDKFVKNSEDPKLFENLKKQLQETLGEEKGSKFAEAYKKAVKPADFTGEDAEVRSLTETQNKLAIELDVVTKQVADFKTAFDKTTITQSIDALSTAMNSAATNLVSFQELTSKIDSISRNINVRLGALEGIKP